MDKRTPAPSELDQLDRIRGGPDTLGRKTRTRAEIDRARAVVEAQLAACRAPAGAGADFEATCFNSMTLVLDRHFVHRLRTVTGHDGNPLDEVELICESLLNSDGVLCGSNVARYVPAESVVKLRIGDRIRLTAADLDRLSAACFAEPGHRFLGS